MCNQIFFKRRDLKRFIVMIACAIFLTSLGATCSYAATGVNVDGVMYGGLGVPGYTTNVYNQTGVGNTLLPQNDIVQFIKANGSIHAPNPDGSPGGGDVLLYTGFVGDGGTASDGTFDINQTVAGANGTIVYFRAWNSSSIATATYYGNSATHTTSTASDPPPPAPELWQVASFATTTSVVAGPALSSITPNSGDQGATLNNVAIVGSATHFIGSTTVSISGSGVTVSNISVTDATHLTCTLTITGGAAAGARNVVVTTGAEIVTGTGAFTVTVLGLPVPTVTSVAPPNGSNTSTTPITITGTNFTGATAVKLWSTQSGSITLSYTVNNATSISATVPAGLSTFIYDVTVTTANGTSVTSAADQFTVTALPKNVIYAKAGGIMMAYPNPFNPNDKANPLHMLFEVSSIGDTVNIYIFDANGRIIYQDRDSTVALDRTVTWDGNSSYGGTVDNGIYLVRVVESGKLVAKAKILVIKK